MDAALFSVKIEPGKWPDGGGSFSPPSRTERGNKEEDGRKSTFFCGRGKIDELFSGD